MVKPGYKQTEVGIIPGDWEVKKLYEAAPLQRGFDLPTTNLKSGKYPVVYSNGILNYHSNFIAKGPGVVTGRSGTIGKFQYITQDYWPHNTTLWVTNFKDNNPKFIYYLYSSIRINRFGSGSGVPTLNRNDVHELMICLPKPDEQRAIANALSDMDALITSLDKLIAKKKAIKTATMQQFLTGKKRLPEFNKEWQRKSVYEFGRVTTGGTPSTNIKEYWNGIIPWVTPTDIVNIRDIYITERMISLEGLSAIRELPADSILVTCIASIGKNVILRIKGGCNQQINAITPNDKHCVEYLYYLFEYNKSYLLANSGITATNIISKKDFSELVFVVPDLKEQRAIAQVLSDMDEEIAALEARREKTRAIKQGMMQELLTGRTRLI